MKSIISVIPVGLAAFVGTFCLTYFIRKYAIKKALVDMPGDRTSHDTPTPRGGGIAFVAIWILILILGAATGYLDNGLMRLIVPASLLIAIVGFLDDHYNLSSVFRFVVQIIAASIFISFLYSMDSSTSDSAVWYLYYAKAFLKIIAIVWSINLFNFMDGIDSLASVEGIYIFFVGGIFILLIGGEVEGSLVIVLSFSICGFLVWNLPPAKIFMGDTGSNFLGFIVPAFALICERKYGVPLAVWVILYGAFWYDALLTLIRRVIRKEKWYLPHKLHAYQRMHQSGMSHGKVSQIYLFVNVVLAAIAYVGFTYQNLLYASLTVAILMLTLLYIKVESFAPSSKYE